MSVCSPDSRGPISSRCPPAATAATSAGALRADGEHDHDAIGGTMRKLSKELELIDPLPADAGARALPVTDLISRLDTSIRPLDERTPQVAARKGVPLHRRGSRGLSATGRPRERLVQLLRVSGQPLS
jgi:hypothetical protein